MIALAVLLPSLFVLGLLLLLRWVLRRRRQVHWMIPLKEIQMARPPEVLGEGLYGLVLKGGPLLLEPRPSSTGFFDPDSVSIDGHWSCLSRRACFTPHLLLDCQTFSWQAVTRALRWRSRGWSSTSTLRTFTPATRPSGEATLLPMHSPRGRLPCGSSRKTGAWGPERRPYSRRRRRCLHRGHHLPTPASAPAP